MSSAGGETFLYFAYGSNLLPQRLQQRCPSSRLLCPAQLPAHQLRFHKQGMDGSAKCDAWRCDDPEQSLHGAIYRIANDDRPALDRAEDLGVGYQAMELEFITSSGAMAAMIYCALPAMVRHDLLPFDWYHALVLAGARQHAFPAEYIDSILQVPVSVDQDRERAERHFSLCCGLAGDQ